MKTMPIKCPGLTRRDNSANYRLRVKGPVDLLTHYPPKKELTAPLCTSNRKGACVRDLALRAIIFQGFQDFRTKRDAEASNRASGLPAPLGPDFTQTKAEELASKWLQAALVDEERRRTTNTSSRTEEALERTEEGLRLDTP